eukprot:1194580-Prorocentrum_minimum.AAC.10
MIYRMMYIYEDRRAGALARSLSRARRVSRVVRSRVEARVAVDVVGDHRLSRVEHVGGERGLRQIHLHPLAQMVLAKQALPLGILRGRKGRARSSKNQRRATLYRERSPRKRMAPARRRGSTPAVGGMPVRYYKPV